MSYFIPDNDHVNNLLQSTTKFTEGWTIDIAHGKWNPIFTYIDGKCSPGWWAFEGLSGVGTISTLLKQSTKCGRLDFGNCWNAGEVRVYLEGELIGEAGANTPSQIITFPLHQDSLLELKDEGANSVIKFNNFEMVQCPGGKRMRVSNKTKMTFFKN